MKPVNIGIIGLGTVGCGVVNVLHRNAEEISRRAGRRIVVTHGVVQDIERLRPCHTEAFSMTTNPNEVTDHPDIDIVVELIGGLKTSREVVQRSLTNGKHVVTANKALIAEHGNEIFALARDQGLTVAFEAAVAGGISVIKVLREGLAGNRINRVAGIINGTSNYILTDMLENDVDFSESLKEAQSLGYAESDPAFDIEGTDAAHKLAILASIAYGIPLKFDQVYVEGITSVTLEDIGYATELGYRVKHLGLAIRRHDGIELRTHPCLVPKEELLANVNGVMNAIHIEGDAVGPTLHYGAGAGSEPTASAVVADIVDVVRALTTDPNNRVPHLAFQPQSLSDLPILDIECTETPFYLRLNAFDQPGVLADITRILGSQSISIEAILQKGTSSQGQTVPIVIITHNSLERAVKEAIQEIEMLDCVHGVVHRIRLEMLGSNDSKQQFKP
jgi:homoserine dehydrogenase